MKKEVTNGKRVRIAMFFCCVFMFSFSLSSSVYGTLAPAIIKHFGITLTQSSWISITGSLGNMAINVLLMMLGDRFNKSKLLAVLTAILAVSLFGIGYAPNMAIYLVVNCINGIVAYWIDNLTTAYVSDLYGDERDRYIGILYTLFAVGGACAPTFNTVMFKIFGEQWYQSYRVLGVLIAVFSLCYIVCTAVYKAPDGVDKSVSSEEEKKEEGEKVSFFTLIKNRNMLAIVLSGVTMAFYGYFSGTLPTYFNFTDPVKYSTEIANLIVTCSSVGAMISRFAYVPLAPKLKPIKYLRFQSLFCTAVSLVCLLVNQPVVWMVLCAVSGLVSGCSYTMTVVLTCNEYPENSSSATAASSFASGIAYMIATPIINIVAEKVNFFIAMLVPIVFGFLTFFIYKFMYKENVSVSAEEA